MCTQIDTTTEPDASCTTPSILKDDPNTIASRSGGLLPCYWYVWWKYS